jgi:hypothetical protein
MFKFTNKPIFLLAVVYLAAGAFAGVELRPQAF